MLYLHMYLHMYVNCITDWITRPFSSKCCQNVKCNGFIHKKRRKWMSHRLLTINDSLLIILRWIDLARKARDAIGQRPTLSAPFAKTHFPRNKYYIYKLLTNKKRKFRKLWIFQKTAPKVLWRHLAESRFRGKIAESGRNLSYRWRIVRIGWVEVCAWVASAWVGWAITMILRHYQQNRRRTPPVRHQMSPPLRNCGRSGTKSATWSTCSPLAEVVRSPPGETTWTTGSPSAGRTLSSAVRSCLSWRDEHSACRSLPFRRPSISCSPGSARHHSWSGSSALLRRRRRDRTPPRSAWGTFFVLASVGTFPEKMFWKRRRCFSFLRARRRRIQSVCPDSGCSFRPCIRTWTPCRLRTPGS